MSYFNDLPPEKRKELLNKLNKKLKEEKPSSQATAWFDFSYRNKGFEFMNKKTGIIKSKMELFMMIYPDIEKLNLASINNLKGYVRITKTGWVEVKKEGVTTAIRETDIPTYKKHEKRQDD